MWTNKNGIDSGQTVDLFGIFDAERRLGLQDDQNFVVGLLVVIARRRIKVHGVHSASNRTVSQRGILRCCDGDFGLFNRIHHRHYDSMCSGIENPLDVCVITPWDPAQTNATGIGHCTKQEPRVIPADRRMLKVDRQPGKSHASHQSCGKNIAQ